MLIVLDIGDHDMTDEERAAEAIRKGLLRDSVKMIKLSLSIALDRHQQDVGDGADIPPFMLALVTRVLFDMMVKELKQPASMTRSQLLLLTHDLVLEAAAEAEKALH